MDRLISKGIDQLKTSLTVHTVCPYWFFSLSFISGVTIVKVGGNSGSKGELSYKSGSRHEISSITTATSTTTPTGQLISECLSDVLNFAKKNKKTPKNWWISTLESRSWLN